ncbi:DUF2877 domain-containing protein [Bacillus sp. FJAT-18017]|uniref:DUF2877 domain-containing protein n=1 Tax=Bacillus sp. FJAT-18017 TaxID=1705566 RepID=UPI0006AFA0EC|nr:DUF2877 domain-containing protein [Bacillus sp. FJAT-18017]
MAGRNLYNASAIDRRLFADIASASTVFQLGSIHSVYTNVFNVLGADRKRLISIVNKRIPASPDTIVLEENIDMLNLCIEPGLPVFYHPYEHRIQVHGDPGFSLNRVNLLDSMNLKQSRGVQSGLKPICSNLVEFISTEGKEGGFKRVIEKQLGLCDSPSSFYEKALHSALCCFKRALQSKDAGRIILALKGFIGLGPGLTPSGDDFVTGFVSALYTLKHPLYEMIKGHFEELIEFSRKRTTTVSYFMLKHALEGRVNETVASLYEATHSQTASGYQSIERPLRRIAEIGSSSGTDLLAGIAYAFFITIEEDQNGSQSDYKEKLLL